MIFGFLGKFWIYIGKNLFKKSRKHMSKMSNFFRDLKKTSKHFPIEKVNEKWKFRLWVCPWVMCDSVEAQLFFEVPWDFWETSIFFRKEARYQRFYPIPSCGVCEHLCKCLPLVWTRPLGYKNLYSNRVYFAVFEDALEYKIIVDYWVLKNTSYVIENNSDAG